MIFLLMLTVSATNLGHQNQSSSIRKCSRYVSCAEGCELIRTWMASLPGHLDWNKISLL